MGKIEYLMPGGHGGGFTVGQERLRLTRVIENTSTALPDSSLAAQSILQHPEFEKYARVAATIDRLYRNGRSDSKLEIELYNLEIDIADSVLNGRTHLALVSSDFRIALDFYGSTPKG